MDSSATPEPTSMITDLEILRKSSIFAGTPIEVVQLFAYLSEHKQYQAGEMITTKGTEADRAHLLISGEVEITTIFNDKEVVLQHLHKDTFFGELALLARFDWFFNARALTVTDIITIDRTSFEKVLEKFPERRNMMIERIIQLRVKRLTEQTTFMLEKFSAAGIIETGSTSTAIA